MPGAAFPDASASLIVSVAATWLFSIVNDTAAPAASSSAFIVICPLSLFRVTAVAFDVAWLTAPPAPAAALAWAVSQKSWIEGQLERCLPPQPFVPGAVIPLEGENVRLCWSEDLPRSPRLADAGLCCGGPLAGFSARIERFLKRRALETLSREPEEIAGKVALSVAAVSIGDARTRWGSCSSTGRIRYSWRLILAPPAARRYVVAHEVAHLKHLDHGPAFKALERELFGGDVAAANSILRSEGLRLRRIGLVR